MPPSPRITIGRGIELPFDAGHLHDSLVRRGTPPDAAELVTSRVSLRLGGLRDRRLSADKLAILVDREAERLVPAAGASESVVVDAGLSAHLVAYADVAARVLHVVDGAALREALTRGTWADLTLGDRTATLAVGDNRAPDRVELEMRDGAAKDFRKERPEIGAVRLIKADAGRKLIAEDEWKSDCTKVDSPEWRLMRKWSALVPGLDTLPDLSRDLCFRQIGRWYSHFFPQPGDDFGSETFLDVERIQTYTGQDCGSGAAAAYVASNQWVSQFRPYPLP